MTERHYAPHFVWAVFVVEYLVRLYHRGRRQVKAVSSSELPACHTK